MILYLGMPRCATSWIYAHLKTDSSIKPLKESNYFYTNPRKPIEYAKSNFIDFSTNNWSMDSDIATQIDPFITNYIFIFREPLAFAKSYYLYCKQHDWIGSTITFDIFVETLINGKTICFGDILERWTNLVDSKKILVYDYNSINETWLKKFAEILGINISDDISSDRINSSLMTNENLTITNRQQEILTYQTSKLNSIIKEIFPPVI